MRWFEAHLQKMLIEAGREGLRINVIVRNACNMEPSLFGTKHPYDKAWQEIYMFLRSESNRADSPYGYVRNQQTGEVKRGYFFLDKEKMKEDPQRKLDF